MTIEKTEKAGVFQRLVEKTFMEEGMKKESVKEFYNIEYDKAKANSEENS
jgi:hypothetical protein